MQRVPLSVSLATSRPSSGLMHPGSRTVRTGAARRAISLPVAVSTRKISPGRSPATASQLPRGERANDERLGIFGPAFQEPTAQRWHR